MTKWKQREIVAQGSYKFSALSSALLPFGGRGTKGFFASAPLKTYR